MQYSNQLVGSRLVSDLRTLENGLKTWTELIDSTVLFLSSQAQINVEVSWQRSLTLHILQYDQIDFSINSFEYSNCFRRTSCLAPETTAIIGEKGSPNRFRKDTSYLDWKNASWLCIIWLSGNLRTDRRVSTVNTVAAILTGPNILGSYKDSAQWGEAEREMVAYFFFTHAMPQESVHEAFSTDL